MSHQNMIVPSEIGASSIVLPGALPTPLKALPQPGVAIDIRVGTRADIPAIDALQKKHSKALGFFPRAQLEGYIDAGHVLVAEGRVDGGRSSSTAAGRAPAAEDSRPPSTRACPPRLLGYVASKDRYLKRDELGAIFQLCVAPGAERKFVGATLLREVFNRSSYGTRLYCCWCAQDLAANKFWEAMGFAPLAYRAGGRGSRLEVRSDSARPTSKNKPPTSPRVHIFWQKRIRSGDDTTPYWFPAKTEGGAIREDRIILPIPPGMRWWDELPILSLVRQADEGKRLGGVKAISGATRPAEKNRPRAALGAPIRFLPTEQEQRPTEPKPKREKAKADPALIAKARELRDRWLECDPHQRRLTPAKYDLRRSPELFSRGSDEQSTPLQPAIAA